DAVRVCHAELPRQRPTLSPAQRRDAPLTLARVARSEHARQAAGGELPAHLEADPAIGTGDQCYRSVHTASSFPLGSLKWKRRPPGNEYVLRTILPPACLTFPSVSSRWAA